MRQPHCGERANKLEAQNHPDSVEVDAAGIWSEGRASYPGNPEVLREVTDVWCHATGIVRCRDRFQASAEAIVVGVLADEGPNLSRAESRMCSLKGGQKLR